MHATTDPAEISALLPSQPRSDSALTALYRAALGPVTPSAYLPVFARFDEVGRTTTHWNWVASLCTLNWLVFRQLWGAALVYVAAAEGLAHRLGLDVPGDVSIVGFDDTSIADNIWPALTTVHQPIAAMARAAVDLVLEEIRRKRDGSGEPLQLMHPHTLIVRDSSGPVAG